MPVESMQYPPDAAELKVPDVDAAAQLMRERRPDLFPVMHEVGRSFLEFYGASWQPLLLRTLDAVALSFARMASRHGSWGNDLHQYHNEGHSLELLHGRIAKIRVERGWGVLDAVDWLLLALFATCHDLRQRETPDPTQEIGANERASIAETFRILDAAGFHRDDDQDFYATLGYMIAGSTFDARPLPFNTAEVVSAGGCLAPKLVHDLEVGSAEFTSEEALHRCSKLMLIAADIDTANVAEPFSALAASAVRLAQEREMRSGRSIQAPESGPPVYEFLTEGQERYFFKLHRFVSPLGNEVFGHCKDANAPKVRLQTRKLHALFGHKARPGVTGQQLIDAFVKVAAELS